MNKILFFKIINWFLSWRPLGSNRFWWNLMWFTTLSLATKQPCLMNGTCTEGWTKRLPLWQNTGSVNHPPLVANHMEENYQPHCCWSESVLKPGLELVSSRPGFSFLCREKSGWAGGVMVSEGIHLSTGSALLLNLLNHPRWEKQDGARLQDFLFHF